MEVEGLGDPAQQYNHPSASKILVSTVGGDPAVEVAGLDDPAVEVVCLGDPAMEVAGLGDPAVEVVGLGDPAVEVLGLGDPLALAIRQQK